MKQNSATQSPYTGYRKNLEKNSSFSGIFYSTVNFLAVIDN